MVGVTFLAGGINGGQRSGSVRGEPEDLHWPGRGTPRGGNDAAGPERTREVAGGAS